MLIKTFSRLLGVKSEEEIRKIQNYLCNNTPVFCNVSIIVMSALAYFEKGLLKYHAKAVKATISIIETNYTIVTFVTKSGKEYTINPFSVFYNHPDTAQDYRRRFTELSEQLANYCGDFIKFDAENLKIYIG